MKNTILLSAIILVLATSCQKPQDWNCTCECTTASGSTFENSTFFINQTRSEANSNCDNFGRDQAKNNGSWSCKIN